MNTTVSESSFLISILHPWNEFLHTLFTFVEKGEPRSAGGGQAQHQSQEDSGGEDEKADAERGVLEEKRGRGALEDGDAVWLYSFILYGSTHHLGLLKNTARQ